MSTDVPQAPAPKKSKKIILLVAVILGGTLIGGGAGAFMAGPLLAGGEAKSPPAASGDSASHGDDVAGDEAEGGDHGSDEAKGEQHAPSAMHMVENLVLNPANSGGSRFLLLSVGLAVKDEATVKVLQERDPELRDAIIRFFGAYGVEELVDITRRDSLKVQLRTVVGERFGSANVRDVYFPQFVIQ